MLARAGPELTPRTGQADEFATFETFDIPRSTNGLVSRDASQKRAFWQMVETSKEGLSEACGCTCSRLSPAVALDRGTLE
jgi:hypothetical protein